MVLGALEAGGTKMVCAIGDEHGNIHDQISISTQSPKETIVKIIDYFSSANIDALGIGCFGPIDLDKSSSTYGHITSTPKLSWQNYHIVGALQQALGVPIGFDTDVNASVLGEATYGATKGLDSSLYITVGTGIGVGIYMDGNLVHGLLHPEAGHVLVSKHPEDVYQGKCPFHPTCLESLASGPAIEERWGTKAVDLTSNSEVWKLEAYYLAQAITNYILTVSPKRIVLGGGVMKQDQLFALIRENVKTMLNGYLKNPALDDLDGYIVSSACNGNQGILGCFQLAYLELYNK